MVDPKIELMLLAAAPHRQAEYSQPATRCIHAKGSSLFVGLGLWSWHRGTTACAEGGL